MTNLICAVIVTLATNWVTVSRTVPIFSNPTWAVHVDTMLNQIGTRVTNYVALVEWKGRTNAVVLESVADAIGERLERSVPEDVNCYPIYLPELHWEKN